MVRQFWRAFSGLVLISTLFTMISWWYLVSTDIVLTQPVSRSQLLSLPTSIPSIWNMIRPSTNISWIAPLVVLIVQVFLTGGFYGWLIRANTRRAVTPGTFVVDAARSFWRLFLWYMLWTGIGILVAGIDRVFPQMNFTLAAVLLLLRYMFLFVDMALVSERNIREAFQSAVSAMFSNFVGMLPFGILLILVTSVALSVSTMMNWLALLGLSVVYGAVMAWLLHMVVARYLYFSDWEARSGLSA